MVLKVQNLDPIMLPNNQLMKNQGNICTWNFIWAIIESQERALFARLINTQMIETCTYIYLYLTYTDQGQKENKPSKIWSSVQS